MTARRRGRWTYNSDSGYYGEAGWHLDGTPLVVDFMPAPHGYDGKGCYMLYGWPGREHEELDRHVDWAMRFTEQEWDALDHAARRALADYRRSHETGVSDTTQGEKS